MGKIEKMTKKDVRAGIIGLGIPVVTLDDKRSKTNWFETDFFTVDWVLGHGFPLGRIVEAFGEESSGKSLLCTIIAARVLKMGGVVVLFDKEKSFDPEFAKVNGLDSADSGFIYVDESDYCLEDIYRDIQAFTELVQKFDKPVIILWDSLEATPSRRELEQAKEGKFGSHEQGSHRAQVNSKSLRQVHSRLSDSNVGLFIVNQTRERVANPYGQKTITSGGKALRFYAAVRLFVKKEKISTNSNGQITGITCTIESVKNKVAVPYRKMRYSVDFQKGFNDIGSLLAYATNNGLVIKGTGGWYKFGSHKFQGENAGPEILAELKSIIYKEIKS